MVVPANVTLNTTATINGPADLIVNSDFSFADITGGGSLTVNGNATWTGGTLGKNFTVQNGNTLTLSTSSVKVLSAVSLINNGTVSFSGGILYLTSSNFTNNNALFANDNTSINDNGGTNSFVNTGSYSKIGSTASSTISVATTNSGSMSLVNGDVTLNSTMTNTGQINFASG